MKDESPKAQLIQKIKAVNNILVTVSRNPSVDQLVSALALAMALNKLGKRSVAVFSGQIPAEIHFLDPEKVFESNADSLRDFIISISVDKADRMQVKPEGDFVKVYITPYRTTITPDDLRFEDGDFNIELIIAIGVASRDELDASIASHGKIFHNAVTATMNLSKLNDALGTISWQDERLGCYSEMCYSLAVGLAGNDKSLIDSSVATAFLTGVVLKKRSIVPVLSKEGYTTSLPFTGLTVFTVATITNSLSVLDVVALRKNAPKIGTSPNNGTFLIPSASSLRSNPPITKLSPSATSNVDFDLRVSK